MAMADRKPEVDVKLYASAECTRKFFEAAGISDYYTENCQSAGQLKHLRALSRFVGHFYPVAAM